MLSFRSPIHIFDEVCRSVGDVVSARQVYRGGQYNLSHAWWQIYEFLGSKFNKHIIKKGTVSGVNVYKKFEGELKNFIPRDFIGHIQTQCGSMCSIMGGSKQRKTRKKIRRKRTRRRLRKAKKISRKRFRKLTKRL